MRYLQRILYLTTQFFCIDPKRRTPGVCGAMSKMFVGGCWYFLEKCWKTGGKRTRCPRQPIVDMDVDCRRPRHDENYSSLFVENSHPETLHRDMCIACSGSSWILPMYSTNSQFTRFRSASRWGLRHVLSGTYSSCWKVCCQRIRGTQITDWDVVLPELND